MGKKKIFIIFLVMFVSSVKSYSQNKYSTTSQGPTFTARSYDETLYAPMVMTGRYEENLRILLELRKVIIRGKSYIEDERTIKVLNKKLEELSILERGDLANYGEYLYQIYVEIHELNEQYNQWVYENERQKKDQVSKTNYSSEMFITTIDPLVDEMEVYSEPSVNSLVRYVAKKGCEVKVIDNTQGIMFKVVIDGYSGYVSKYYLKRQW